MPYTSMNQDEVASYLHLATCDVERLVRERKIPFSRQGKRLVFKRWEIDEWASKRIMGMSETRLRAFHENSSARAHDLSRHSAIVTELMQEAYIEPELTAKTKPSVVRSMVELADRTSLVVYPEELHEGLVAREKMGSTAMAGGFALLHTEYHDPEMFEDSFIVLGRSVQAVPFHSPDGQVTDLFFLLCCQDNRIHLHVLARLCMMCQHTSLLLELRESANAAAMMQAIETKEREMLRLASK